MDDVDHADERGRSEHDGRGAPKDFNAFEIVEIERAQSRVERAAPWHIVHDEQKGIKFLEAPEFRHGARRPVVAAWRDVNASRQRERTQEISDTAVPQLVAADDLDGHRYFVRYFRCARRHNFHVLMNGGYLGCRRGWALCRRKHWDERETQSGDVSRRPRWN